MPKTILVVDDSPIIQMAVSSMLVGAGFKVLTAGEGAKAIEMAQTQVPDLIVLDVMMPGMDGFTALRKLKYGSPQTRNIPVLMLTAKDQMKEACALEGAAGFIEKDDEAMVGLVSRVIDLIGMS